ncbi:MAG: ferritin-like domain-containing protein [Deltaproteobacteria bacterium]|nr:ferritin-like domain-containing protein [Deltaproteobacteria bacterium]
MRSALERWLDAAAMLASVRDPRVLRALGPSGVRGLLLQRGKQGGATPMRAHHDAWFDWHYPSDQPAMAALYRRAKEGQWDGDDLPWDTSVDPLDPERPLLPRGFIAAERLGDFGVRLTEREEASLRCAFATWMLSQFLHGEQGALFAAAQVTEAVQFFDGKLYGATQVMDEGRHVEVFNRYLDTKLNRLYQVNDNLFVILDALMQDGRWDMKFLGMQIMIEGLALGAFGVLYRRTGEPLLKALLKNVIQDEARHVHYGVVALREHYTHGLSARDREEREDWAFEVALLLRNRFLAFEVYDEWFAGRLSRAQWVSFVQAAPGMQEFREVMFRRLVPNLREIGLLSPRVAPRYEAAGLFRYADGLAADRLTAEGMLTELQ